MKNQLKTICFLTFMLFATLTAGAQSRYRLTGEVVDAATGRGVGFATISLVDTTSSAPATAWVSDGNGRFDHTVSKAGDYRLEVTMVGYKTHTQPITIVSSPTRVETIRLSEGVEIAEVAVTTTKPLVRSEIDKIAYSVADDPDTPVSSALDILRKVPLITVDAEDNVQLQGQGNYKVLVNGKASSMMDNNFKEVIRSMPANSIKDIEVITSPGSKYEAEGVGGIINIVTTRARFDGYNGSIGLRGDSFGGYGANGFLSLKLGKFSLSANAHYGDNRRPDARDESYQQSYLTNDLHHQYGAYTSKNSTDFTGINLEASYEIDTFNLVSLSLRNFGGNFFYDADMTTRIYDIDDVLRRSFDNRSRGRGQFGSLSGNVDYQRTFLKPGKTFTFSYLVDGNPNDTENTLTVDGILDYRSYQQRSVSDTWSRSHTLQIDYVDPLTDKHTIEAGTKAILRQNGSDPQTYERLTDADPWVLNPLRRDALDYNQYIWGLYGAYTYKLKKFSAKAGARAETTWNDGRFTNAAGTERIDGTLFNVIPYASVSLAPKPSDRYTISYTQRLSRPGIWYLNPYVNDDDPMNISYGNPDLEAEISHTFEANYSSFGPKISLRAGVGVVITDNSIERITEMDDQGRRLTTYYNIGNRDRYALNLFYSWRPSGKFSVTLNGSGGYMVVDDGRGMRNEGWSYNGSLNSRVALWKDGSMTLNGFYSSPRQSLQGESSGFYYYAAGFTQRAFKQKVTFTIGVVNPFNKELKFTNEIEDETFYSRSENRQPMRQVQFGATWNFGKANVQVRKARRGITNDDVKAGESNSGGGQTGAQQQ